MAEFPFMPWHWQAYFADTKHLTCLEHGAYQQILGTMWLSGGELPDDDTFLIRTTGLDRRQWRRMKPTIMAFMRPTSNGKFTQNNLLDKLKAVQMKSVLASDSARARWLKLKGLPHANALRTHYERNATKNSKIESNLPVQSTTQGEKESGSAEKQAEVAAPPASPADKEDSIPISSYLLSTKLMKRRA